MPAAVISGAFIAGVVLNGTLSDGISTYLRSARRQTAV
jgi:hypothetical protein